MDESRFTEAEWYPNPHGEQMRLAAEHAMRLRTRAASLESDLNRRFLHDLIINKIQAELDSTEERRAFHSKEREELGEKIDRVYSKFNASKQDSRDIITWANELSWHRPRAQGHMALETWYARHVQDLQRQLEAEHAWVASFEWIAAERELSSVRQTLRRDIRQLHEAYESFQRVEARLAPLRASLVTKLERINVQLRESEEELAAAKTQVSKAEHFIRSLESADTSLQRRKIHEECEASFDDGNPSRVLQTAKRRVQKAARDLRKFEKHRSARMGADLDRRLHHPSAHCCNLRGMDSMPQTVSRRHSTARKMRMSTTSMIAA